MLILFAKSQLALFNAPVQVSATVRKDGTVVKPHIRIQKVALKPHQQASLFGEHVALEPAKKRSKLDAFIAKHGGLHRLASMLAGMTEGQQQRIFEGMAKLDGKEPAEIAAMFDGLAAKEPAKGETGDLFAQPAPAVEAAPAPAEPAGPELVEHVTGKGKTLRGVIMHGSKEDAQAIDAYTFKKNGGWFIREKHLVDGKLPSAAKEPAAQIDAKQPETRASTHSEPLPAGPFGVPAGITKTRRREINAKVVELVTSGKTEFSDEDRALMRQYSGNGGCGDSLNEFYTDPAVARAMWDVLGKLGVASGTALEPSCATGVFLHTAPAGFKVTGVELDPTSAKCAEVLHGDRHEIINASLERFATQDGDRQFDVVIGNVPFGLRGSLLKDDKPTLKTAEGYFLDTALDKTRPGGVVALIVPTGVMDAKSQRGLRERLLRKGEFLGAVRMPNTAFEHSHTEVTTDIVFFRKRADDVAGALMTVKQGTLKDLGVWDEDYLSGAYFETRGADSIFGTMEAGWRAKAGIGQDITVSGSMRGVPESIAAWTPDEVTAATPTVPDILGKLDEAGKKRALGAALKKPYDTSKPGDTKAVDGVTYILQGKPPRWHRIDEFLQDAGISDAQPIAAEIERMFNGQAVDRPALEAAVRAYVEKHGIPGKNPNLNLAASQDKTLYRLIGAVNPDGTISDAVAGRGARKVEGSLDTAAVSLSLERDSGTFSVAELADRIGKDVEEVEDTLFASPAYAYAGSGQWTTMDNYLTGELWPKLDAVKAEVARGDLRDGLAEKYAMQAAKLEETIDPKSLEDVEVMLNSAFVPTDILAAYFNERKAASDNDWVRKLPDVKITFNGGVYTVEGGNQHGEMRLLDKYLNRTGVKKDDMPQIEQMNADFKAWLLSSRYRDQVEELYNRKFRGFRQRDFSNAAIAIPGMNTEGLKDYQYGGLRWALAAGKGIIAADVGLGKTVRGLMLARMAKINGQSKRPTFVVPKSVLANWVAEADKWFPGSRVLVIGETYTKDKDGNLKSKPDTAAERNRKYHEMTQNDYDFVFISQPAFNDLDLDPITKGQYVNDDFWVQRGDKLGNAGDKRLNKVREAYKQAIADREFQKRTDAIYFNDLGIDMLLVDEGHAFKNLYAARARFGESPKFLGGQGLSNRALDMNLKTRWVREQNSGNGIYMMTATPTKNSPLEIYSMLSHIAPEAFERIGIRNSEEFLDRFCEFANDKILGTDGTIQDALVTVGFKNLGELREIMKRFIDRKTAADVGLVLPTRNDQMHMIDMTDEQKAVYSDLREQMAELATKKDATGDAHIFSIMDKMAKAAMDLELLDAKTYAGAKSPKYAKAAVNIAAGAKDGGQVVFAESVASHEKIAAALVAAGIPRDQIAIINAQAAESSAKRQNISDAFNSGKIKVVIGNKTMEEGINLQKATTDIHHLDLPWEPASMQQRNGRGLRQGNINEAVRIHTYITKGSFDGYRYQSMMAKKDWQDLLWNGGDRVDNMAREGKFDRSDLLIMMSADPEAERAKFEADKAAAQERHDAEQRRSAASEFVRFQVMKRSYRDLQNKKTQSAERLRAKIERAKTLLSNNKYFSAKGALDSDQPVVIHPDTGLALQRGVGLDVTEHDGTAGKWVVTDVNPLSGDVSMRRYGELGKGGRAITVPMTELSHGVSAFPYKADEEEAEVAKQFAADAEGKVAKIEKVSDLRDIPQSIIAANYAGLQSRLKEAEKGYRHGRAYGARLAMIGPDGKAVLGGQYGVGDKLDTHDIMLPTPEHKEQAIQAYIDTEREKELARVSEYRQGRRGRSGDFVYTLRNTYPTGTEDRTNPWGDAGVHVFGEGFKKEAHDRFEHEQRDRAKAAKDLAGTIDHLVPTADIAQHTGAKWPSKSLAMVYARAKRDGLLDKPVGDFLSAVTMHSMALVRRDGYGGSTVTSPSKEPLSEVLPKLAKQSGHADLAAAMIVATPGTTPEQKFRQLLDLGEKANVGTPGLSSITQHTYPPAVLNAMHHLSSKHSADTFFDKKVSEVASRHSGSYSRDVDEVFGGRNQHVTLRELLAGASSTKEAA
jgi:N12 class adenine-specific DNA methylase/predicted RNA methylase